MKTVKWDHEAGAGDQISELCVLAREPGFLIVEFEGGDAESTLSWRDLEPWTRSRAVTVADIRSDLAPPALDVALCADLVYPRDAVALTLSLSAAPPPPGVIWALGRAGRRALERGLLDLSPISAREAQELGIVQGVVAAEDSLPLPSNPSIAALTTARDVMRASVSGSPGLGLELASFRLLFAADQPEEGARAFLEKRKPVFDR